MVGPAVSRRQVVDAALAAVTTAVVAIAVGAELSGQRRGDPTAYVFAAGFGALILVRRRHPVLTLVATGIGLLAYHALGYPPVGLALPVAAALFSAAEAGRAGWAVAVAGALLVISSVARVAGGEDPRYLFAFEAPTTLAVMAAAITLGDGVRSRRLWQAEVSERTRRAAAERAEAAARQVQRERMAVAREVHDVLAHTLSVVTLHAQVAEEALDDGRCADARRALGLVRAAGGHAGRDLRRTLRILRDPADDTGQRPPVEPPVGAITDLVRLVADPRAAGPRVHLRCADDLRDLPLDVQHAAYRIVQQALTNTRQHSDATAVEVRVERSSAGLTVEITDDGAGSPAAADAAGHGLAGMRERAEVLGGDVDSGPLPGGGFRIRARLPLEPSP